MLKVTILLDHSNLITFRPEVKLGLYSFLIQVLSKLRVSTKKTLYRFGGFGSRACCLVPCSKEKRPFLYELRELSVSPHQEWTETAKEEVLTVLHGQPFPSLGYNDIRSVLNVTCNGKHAADHVVVVTSWPHQNLDETWEVMQSVASVTLVNLDGVKPDRKRLPSLNEMWWVEDNTAERLAKKLHFATLASLKSKHSNNQDSKEMKLTLFEKKQIEMINYLLQSLPSSTDHL